MSTKVLERAEMKAATAVDQHEIDFYLLAFSPAPDKQGDRIDPHAVDEWLDSFYKAGRPFPISFTHAAVKNAGDPFAIVGSAPADREHVFKDDHGVRVRATLDTETNETARQVYSLVKRGIINGASVSYFAEEEQEDPAFVGGRLILKMSPLEGGPCLDPANPEALVMSIKSMDDELAQLGTAIDEAGTKALDESAWDANRAMGQCNTAADYRSICAGERSEGDPDQRQHWALPHHYLGRPANAAGVQAARARFGQTQGLTNASEARTHIFETHRLPSDSKSSEQASETIQTEQGYVTVNVNVPDTKAGRAISRARAQRLRDARSIIDELLAEAGDEDTPQGKANTDEPETANVEEPGPNAWLHEALAAAERSA